MGSLFVTRQEMPLFVTCSRSFFRSLTDGSGKEWCEVLVPPKLLSKMRDAWPSLVVEPSQVWSLPCTEYFVFSLMPKALLRLYYRDEKGLLSEMFEQATSEEILSRYLQHAAWLTGHVTSGQDCILDAVYHDYQVSGLCMSAFLDLFFQSAR